MYGVKGSSRVVGEGEVPKGICNRPEESKILTERTATRESSPTFVGSDKVIHAAPRGTQGSRRRGVLAIAPKESCTDEQPSKKKLKYTREPIAFNDGDLEGTI